MLKKIKKMLTEKGIHSGDVPEWLNRAARDVLTGVQKAGMLPPQRTYNRNNVYNGILDANSYTITDNSWEPEKKKE